MTSRFSEKDTESFYDAEDALYRSFWDREGSLHWGWFDETTGGDFLSACVNLNRVMLEKADIEPSSRVLDLGCGNGNTSIWLCRDTGCHVTGIDLSGVRINNAIESVSALPGDVRARLRFEKASATELPFEGGEFSHVWSQATLYHVHERETALHEAYRVLAPGGCMIFDDLIKPKPDISDDARQYVYDRLLFDTDYSYTGYQDALRKVGFQVLEAYDLSDHLGKSYTCLGRMAAAHRDENPEVYGGLANAYGHMVEAVERQELGWALYVCRK